MLEAINSFYLAQLISLIGIGMFIDSIILPKHKRALSGYIFRIGEIHRDEFEAAISTGFIEMLCDKRDISKLSFRKMVAFSIISNIIMLTIAYLAMHAFGMISETSESYTNDEYVGTTSRPITLDDITDDVGLSDIVRFVLLVSGLGLLCSIVTLPFEYASMLISKKIWYYRVHNSHFILPLIFFDAFLSISLVAVVSRLFAELPGFADAGLFSVLMFPVIAMATSTIVLNLFHLIVSTIGMLLRFAAGKMKQQSKDHFRKLKAFPVATCFTALGVVLTILEYLL